jgi:hypothetical protein
LLSGMSTPAIRAMSLLLSLSLDVLGVGTDNADHAMSADGLALVTPWFY